MHASVDWFWPYPALTAPVLALAGSACAPAVARARPALDAAVARLADRRAGGARDQRDPAWLSERYVNNAYAGWRTDLDRAYDDLDRAQQLNPLSDMPLLAEGAIARAAGDRERALAAFREAAELRPEEWATHYLLAELQADERPAPPATRSGVALELNPLSRPRPGAGRAARRRPGRAPTDA